MIIQLFNTSVVSGPELLVVPALADKRERFMVVNLLEHRLAGLRENDPLGRLCNSLGLRYATVPVKARWDRGAIRALRALIEAEKPELVHAHALKASVYAAMLRGWRPSAPPIVSTHHGVHTVPTLKNRIYEFLYRRYFLRYFDRVLCVSGADFQIVSRSGIRADRLRIHLNGIDSQLVEPGRRPETSRGIRAAWLPHEPSRDHLFLMGVVGRLSAEKDHSRVLKVLHRLQAIGCEADWRCLMFGSGELEHRLRRECTLLGLDRRVLWMGYRGTVGKELSGLDLLLSFSMAEGLPINLIEAGWAGTAVIGTLVGGVPELIPDETYGTGIPQNESIDTSAARLRQLLSSTERSTLQGQGKRFQERIIAHFSRARWMVRLAEIYAELGIRV